MSIKSMPCNIKPNKINYYVPENLDVDNFPVDQTVLIRETDLKKVPFLNYNNDSDKCQWDDENFDPPELYAYVNSYYAHTEDSDPLGKVSSLLAQPDYLELSREKEAQKVTFPNDAYSEKEAQLRYLESKPLSFLILGKPDIGQKELALKLANHWGCVYVEPQTLIEEEIESGSRAGECIEFNLRGGRAIGAEIILNLVKQKVKSEPAKHRGFVLCGLPVICNNLYEEDPLSSESAIFTARDIFEEVFVTTANMCIAPSNPQVSVASKYQSDLEGAAKDENLSEIQLSESQQQQQQQPAETLDNSNIGKDYEKQLDFLFGMFDEPLLIIYIQCGTMDVLTKRDNFRFDIASNQVYDMQRLSYLHAYKAMLAEETEEDAHDFDLIEELFDLITLSSEHFRMGHLVKLPGDFKANVSTQLDQYHYICLHLIQNRILAHNPEYFIKVDGRTSVCKMMSLIDAKLKTMNVQKVVVPRKLTGNDLETFYNTTETLLAEDAASVKENEEKLRPQQYYGRLKRQNVPSKRFSWSWSEWGSKCPVSMKQGFTKEGDAKYSVQFMNKIFFLANYEAYSKFYQNPRPYLLPPFPRPTCKIFIFGPKRSGRTALANCLAYYLGGSVLSTDELMNEFMKQREDEYLEKIRQQAIAEGIKLLNEQRALEAEEQERIRIEEIKEWVKTVIGLLEEMSNLLSEIEKEEQKEKFEISSFPMAMKRMHTSEMLEDSEYAAALSHLREQLQELNLPIYKLDVATWKSYISERRKLLQYLPGDLSQKYQPKPATVFDDFVKEYVANALAEAGLKDLQISGGGILEMFISHIKQAEAKYRKQGFNSGGWIIDGMTCNLPIVQDFFPDYIGDDIILLKDSSDWLENNYAQRKTTFFRDFRNFFVGNGLMDAAWRSPSMTSTSKYKENMVKSILEEILENDAFYLEAPEESEEDDNLKPNFGLQEYKKHLITFQSDWNQVKQFYYSHNITPIEIDVSNKTIPELFELAIQTLDSKYTYAASVLSAEDLAEEEIPTLKNLEEEDAVPSTTHESSEIVSEPIQRQYGDTYHFCPVTFIEKSVLWKGKQDFAAKYNEKVYLLATKSDLEKFLQEPGRYSLSGYSKMPPPRLCVIGVSKSGKTTLSKSLSENYGLIYISYERFLKESFNISSSKETLNDIASNPNSSSELRSYLNHRIPLPVNVVDNFGKHWSEEPFKSIGFVLDDFPKTLSDIDFMVANKLIPDVILCLDAEENYLKSKFLERFQKHWQETVGKQLQESELRHKEKWLEQRSVRFNVLIEERREKRYASKLDRNDVDNMEPVASQVSFDSVAEQQDIDEINKILDSEFPPLAFDEPNLSELVSNMDPIISNQIKSDLGLIFQIKDKCNKEQIPIANVPLNLDSLSKTEIAAYLIVEPLKFRGKSHLDRCQEVSLDLSESLLNCGYVFLSKFGKTCPVQAHDKDVQIQLYRVALDDGRVYPIVHRSYVYYIVGAKQKDLFINDPLKYIHKEFKFPLIRHRVAVTGGPKSGKSTLAKRIKKEFGFKLITRGRAVRYVLKYLFESDLAKNMETVLRKGWELTDEMVAKCVEAATFDARAITQGIIFDGFPNSLNESRHLAYLDLVPRLVIDLDANLSQIIDNGLSVTDKPMIRFGERFLNHLHEEWLKEADAFRQWFDREYQAMRAVELTAKWAVWHRSESYLTGTFYEVNHYFQHVVDDWPVRLATMLVTPLEFLERRSCYKSYCPLCLHYSNSLVSGGEPPDRTGLVQFRSFFYWLCQDHVELFLKSPQQYLPPYNAHGMPESLPKRVFLDSIPSNVYENGACAVCYKSKRIITKGKLEFCVSFRDKVYLFDTIDCLNLFLRSPTSFTINIEFHSPVYPELKYRDLPIMGMLEQYLAKYVVAGISFVAKRRPVIPGLSVTASALIGLGLFMKVKNDQSTLKSYYEEGFRIFNQRRDNLLNYLDYMKTYRNPYLYYEEILPEFRLPPPSTKSQSLTTMISRLVDQCVDNIDLYLKDADDITSDTQSDSY